MFFDKKKIRVIFISATIACLCGNSLFFSIKALRFYRQHKNCQNVVVLTYGLGNQLFNYAFGYALEKGSGKSVCFVKKLPENRQAHEDGYMHVFNAKIHDIKFEYGEYEKKYRYLPRFIRKYLRYSGDYSFNKKASFAFQPVLLRNNYGFNYYQGLYMNYNYFDKYRNEIIQQLSLKIPLDEKNKKMIDGIKKYKNSVSIHIRRGDYLKYEWYRDVITFDNYYNKALKIFEKMEDVHYFIFSDDPEWVKKNFKTNKPTTYVNINDINHGYFDLELMRNCKHNIIANSTFSWWGAYLNENKDKIVVAPRRYNNRYETNKDLIAIDYYPNDWVVIDNN